MQPFDINGSAQYTEAFVKEFMQTNANGIDRYCSRLHNTLPAATYKIISMEMIAACNSFAKKKHDPTNIEIYLFATLHNTINRISNEESDTLQHFNIDHCQSNKILTTDPITTIVKEDIKMYRSVINDTINAQITMLEYSCRPATYKIKSCMYNAFKNILRKHPDAMISNLVFLNRETGLQCKIFQEFVSLLEKELPFVFIQDNEEYSVKALLDDNISIFSGVSEYTAMVNKMHEINNNTQELYVGRRQGAQCRQHYIGKLLDINDCNGSIMNNVKEYGFSKIIMRKRVKANTKVIVRHLRIQPHHQMGGLSHLNRIRRSIVDRVYYSINGKKRVVSR